MARALARRDPASADGEVRRARSEKALEAIRRVTELYGPARWSTKDPLSMLVIIILSQRSRDVETTAGYAALKGRYPTWESMRDAPAAEVEATIQGVRWPELKAPRMQAIMRRITRERGTLSLDFLCGLPLEEGMAWLERLEGVGPKTVACVLLFSCRKPILPVDTHVHRIGIRLGLIGPRVSAEAAHPLLQALLPPDPQIIYNFHNGLLLHGQRVCTFERPRCERCPLTDLCDHYQTLARPAG